MAKVKANSVLIHEGQIVQPGTEIEVSDEQAERLKEKNKAVGIDEKIDAEKGFESDSTEKPIGDMNVAELRGIAQGYGIEGYSDMKKADLVNAVQMHRDAEQA